MKKKIALTLIISLLIASTPAFAKFFRYVDENGVTRFTDNPMIIAQIKENVRTYSEAADFITKAEQKKRVQQRIARTEKKKSNLVALAQLPGTEHAIDIDVLRSEYKDLEKEFELLDKAKNNVTTLASFQAYNVRVQKYKTRMKDYESKRSRLEK
ncbi:DUF4124 domain-containing protein [Desulfobacterales bacterium HSG16]|nr:DUF4124 domain-containing protein [Desulfobacterales bacterium HSG16]